MEPGRGQAPQDLLPPPAHQPGNRLPGASRVAGRRASAGPHVSGRHEPAFESRLPGALMAARGFAAPAATAMEATAMEVTPSPGFRVEGTRASVPFRPRVDYSRY